MLQTNSNMIKEKINNFFTKKVGTHNGSNRDKWLEKTILQLPKGTSILDASAGDGKYKKFCEHLIYKSPDLAEYDGKGDGKGLHTEERDYSNLDFVSDITDMPIENNFFDSVMCVEVIEHVPDPIQALKEIHRVLKPNGNLILTAPFNSLTHYAPFHFSTGFNKYYYEENLKKIGFEIIEIIPNGNYFEYTAQELRRLKYVSKDYSKTKFNIFVKISLYIILNFLYNTSKKDEGSSELLCFGYNVLCKKTT